MARTSAVRGLHDADFAILIVGNIIEVEIDILPEAERCGAHTGQVDGRRPEPAVGLAACMIPCQVGSPAIGRAAGSIRGAIQTIIIVRRPELPVGGRARAPTGGVAFQIVGERRRGIIFPDHEEGGRFRGAGSGVGAAGDAGLPITPCRRRGGQLGGCKDVVQFAGLVVPCEPEIVGTGLDDSQLERFSRDLYLHPVEVRGAGVLPVEAELAEGLRGGGIGAGPVEGEGRSVRFPDQGVVRVLRCPLGIHQKEAPCSRVVIVGEGAQGGPRLIAAPLPGVTPGGRRGIVVITDHPAGGGCAPRVARSPANPVIRPVIANREHLGSVGQAQPEFEPLPFGLAETGPRKGFEGQGEHLPGPQLGETDGGAMAVAAEFVASDWMAELPPLPVQLVSVEVVSGVWADRSVPSGSVKLSRRTTSACEVPAHARLPRARTTGLIRWIAGAHFMERIGFGSGWIS